MSQFFKVIDWALKKDRATMVITATSRPEHRYTEYQYVHHHLLLRASFSSPPFRPDDFARHYHWPNAHIPSATSLAVAVQEAVPGAFVLNNIEDHGPRTSFLVLKNFI